MSNGLLLWVDDEIELLKAHIIFLEKKGYEVVTVSNGADAIEQCRTQTFDLVLLDEQMPGLSGLETAEDERNTACHAHCHGNKERGGRYNEPSHRRKDSRLLD